ncbi:hypothetical protein P43SY_006416 [Pythium insidiosum]|uniref:Uncharacterized protein n=1 Tax=Pythium insidiosum TaxID=114742 RepID=A0AAD5QEH0_PYTIN|nr:hypothetical protein P43SY_006416 [Pythium insidiosum]
MELNEEEEFGMSREPSCENDPVEVDHETSVKDHPDFAFLRPDALAAQLALRPEDPQCLPWLHTLPVEKDPLKWTFLEVLLRPDRAWLVIKELIATVCIGHGMVLTDETDSSMLFRKKVAQDSMAHGMMDMSTFQNLYVHIGVLPSKLRALHVGYVVSNDQSLLGGVMTTHLQSATTSDRMKALQRALDSLLAALQSTLTSQFLSASYLYMTTPENTGAVDSGDAIQLDPGYVRDIRRMFMREIKASMRELCIPLEEYAHTQEYACALLLGVLDPLLKKYNLELTAADSESEPSTAAAAAADDTASSSSPATPPKTAAADSAAPPPSTQDLLSDGKLYGEVITDMVQALWTKLQRERDDKVKQKIEEKRRQVAERVAAVQTLRVRALEAILQHPTAEVSSLKASTHGNKSALDVLLYDGTCVVNNVPARLHVTLGALVYRTMVPLFAKTTVVPLEDVAQVAQTSTLGIRMLGVSLKTGKCLTVATGVDIDLLFQLLLEVVEMHRRESARETAIGVEHTPETPELPPFNDPNLQKLIAQAEEEEKEDDNSAEGSPSASQ